MSSTSRTPPSPTTISTARRSAIAQRNVPLPLRGGPQKDGHICKRRCEGQKKQWQQKPTSRAHKVLYLPPIGSHEYEEDHSTSEAGEPAHHHQRALDTFLLLSFTQELRTEPDQAWAGKLGPMFHGHLFENGVEIRVIHREEPPILLFRTDLWLWRERGRESPECSSPSCPGCRRFPCG